MTCIVAIADEGSVYFGGDTLVVGSYYKTSIDDTKVFERENMLFGTCGSVRMRQLLRYCLNIPTYTGGDPLTYLVTDFIDAVRDCFKKGGLAQEEQGREKGGKFLLGFQGELFYIDHEYDIGKPAYHYYAIGSGEELALGSLFSTAQLGLKPLQRLELALQAAQCHNTDVGSPFTFVTSEKGTLEKC
jgi:20S proteasome alpha/beta subunit